MNTMQEPGSQAEFFLAVFPNVQICIEMIMNLKTSPANVSNQIRSLSAVLPGREVSFLNYEHSSNPWNEK